MKLKYVVLFIVIIMPGTRALAQENYCKYFKLEVERSVFNGKAATSITPQIIPFRGDDTSTFISEHTNRFEYILYNRVDSIVNYSKLYPDTIEIASRFCTYLQENKKIKQYLSVLSNNNTQKEHYTKSDMRKIAARFFLCDRVNKDTTIGYHICIGINGQAELKRLRDFTVLEAFCFEAIFNYMNKPGTPAFIENFRTYISNSTLKYKHSYPDTTALLVKVKNECFSKMENDRDLQTALWKFYEANKNNIGFIIR